MLAFTLLGRSTHGEQPVGHHVTNVHVTEEDGAVRARSKGLAVMADGSAATVGYDDVIVRTDAGWRIKRRRVIASGLSEAVDRAGRR